MKRVAIIVNPISGIGKAMARAEAVALRLSERGFRVTFSTTTCPHSAAATAAELASLNDLFVVVGGDGTLNDVVNGMGSHRLPIAFLPSGTANVVAKELGLPLDLDAFCDSILHGSLRRIDLVRLKDRRFLMMAGAGFDAAVTEDVAAHRRGPITMMTYVPSIARTLARYSFPQIRVEVDGKTVEDSATTVIVANMASYGGPFSVTPLAAPDDGLMDICILNAPGVVSWVVLMSAALAGLLPRMRGAAYHRGVRATLTSSGCVPVQVDGDPAGALPATFEIEHGALDLFIPEGK